MRALLRHLSPTTKLPLLLLEPCCVVLLREMLLGCMVQHGCMLLRQRLRRLHVVLLHLWVEVLLLLGWARVGGSCWPYLCLIPHVKLPPWPFHTSRVALHVACWAAA
jgi:hypothetical protein